jgi:hypothetical protein
MPSKKARRPSSVKKSVPKVRLEDDPRQDKAAREADFGAHLKWASAAAQLERAAAAARIVALYLEARARWKHDARGWHRSKAAAPTAIGLAAVALGELQHLAAAESIHTDPAGFAWSVSVLLGDASKGGAK